MSDSAAHYSRPGSGSTAEGTTVLAACDGVPTWIRSGAGETALLIPAELGPREALRERLCDRRSAALLPLLHFLRARTEAIRWQPPAARASLLFDDPNLHWPSYGFVKLAELGTHAREHDYHVALATVPLDAWFAHPTALRALRASEGAISLLVHGNDHDGGELGTGRERGRRGLAGRPGPDAGYEAFGRRTGVAVDRVMVPPHEACSQATLAGLRRCGFEAITMTRPYPLGRVRAPLLASPARGRRAPGRLGTGRVRRRGAGAAAPPDRRPLDVPS